MTTAITYRRGPTSALMPRRSTAAIARSSTTQVFTPTQPIGMSTMTAATTYAPRRPNVNRAKTIAFTPVR